MVEVIYEVTVLLEYIDNKPPSHSTHTHAVHLQLYAVIHPVG